MDQLTRIHFDFKAIFAPLTTVKALSIIMIVGFIVYGNMLFNGFVWDDKTYVIPSAREYGLNLYQLFAHNPFNSFGYYRPIPATYFSILHVVFGEHTFFYHLIQLLLHLINAALFYLLLTAFTKKHISLVLSLLFLVHPIQVESVSYIAQATSVLLFLFGISALLLSRRSFISKKRLAAIFTLLLLCLLTKESALFLSR